MASEPSGALSPDSSTDTRCGEPEETEGSAGLPREIWVIALISLLSSIGLGVVVPALPALGSLYGVGVAAMTVAISGFAAARLVTNVGLTSVLRRVPLQPILASGLAFQGSMTLLAGSADNYNAFIVFRTFSGVGSAAYTIASTALMVAISPPLHRGRAMSLQAGMVGIGTVSGPAIGGAIVLLDPRLPLAIYGLVLIVGAVMTLVFLHRVRSIRTVENRPEPGSEAAEGDDRMSRVTFRWLLKSPVFATVIVGQMISGAVYYGVRSAILPAYLESVGHTVAFVGIALTIAALSQVLGTVGAGVGSDRFGRFPLLASSYVAAIIGFALLGGGNLVWVALVAFAALGFAGGVQQSATGALLADTPGGRSAAATGAFWITFDIFAIIGPALGGLIAEQLGMWVVLTAAVLVLTWALIHSLVSWRRVTRTAE
ncbi:MFS transporter [Rhodococcus qingshengii]|uniref:MFS transporter n=1 Tax=Rhodococcus qingshengii TaxID=334542 RepID=UPI0028DB6084|nr:MFS transporter [uncultured Rhodococcus sp.]